LNCERCPEPIRIQFIFQGERNNCSHQSATHDLRTFTRVEIHPKQVSSWNREFLERSTENFEGDEKQEEEIERMELEQRLAHERMGA
jgi:hypothetical protein